ncbi:MAG: hypothetical protein ACKVU2_02475 [Saprospiraceae bacterium]
MELEVLQSKQGTKVVAASNLYHTLQLPGKQYGVQVRKWMKDLYEFRDGIRRPQPLRDFARRPRPGEPIEDFYLTLELAKLIALRTNSKLKLKYARLLDVVEQNGQMNLFQQTPAPGTGGQLRQTA